MAEGRETAWESGVYSPWLICSRPERAIILASLSQVLAEGGMGLGGGEMHRGGHDRLGEQQLLRAHCLGRQEGKFVLLALNGELYL